MGDGGGQLGMSVVAFICIGCPIIFGLSIYRLYINPDMEDVCDCVCVMTKFNDLEQGSSPCFEEKFGTIFPNTKCNLEDHGIEEGQCVITDSCPIDRCVNSTDGWGLSCKSEFPKETIHDCYTDIQDADSKKRNETWLIISICGISVCYLGIAYVAFSNWN